MSKVKVSIIMPVYNSEEYLSVAVESVLKQTFEEFELLLIDDGSSDNSPQICDEFQKKDSRVKAIHRKNSGVCATRNYGMSIAQGEYIGFCDNDDTMEPDSLMDNYTLAKENNADVIRFAYERQLIENDKVVSKATILSDFDGVIKGRSNIMKKYYEIRTIIGTAWDHLYRTDFIKEHNIVFDESFHGGGEDILFNLDVMKSIENLVINNKKPYYNWLRRIEHSTSKKTNLSMVTNINKLLVAENRIVRENNIIDPVKWGAILSVRYINYMINSILTGNKKVSRKQFCEIMTEFRKNPGFDFLITKQQIKEIKGIGFKEYVNFKCFYKKRFLKLYYVHSFFYKIVKR